MTIQYGEVEEGISFRILPLQSFKAQTIFPWYLGYNSKCLEEMLVINSCKLDEDRVNYMNAYSHIPFFTKEPMCIIYMAIESVETNSTQLDDDFFPKKDTMIKKYDKL